MTTYRFLYRSLQEKKIQFHPHDLKVKTEKNNGGRNKGRFSCIRLPVTEINTMKGKHGMPGPLVLVEIDKAYKAIFTELQ